MKMKFQRAELEVNDDKMEQMISHARKQFDVGEKKAREIISAMLDEIGEEVYINDLYQVSVRRFHVPKTKENPGMHWLSIKRLDRATIHDWRELQEIKNEIIGCENEAVELFPAESRLVDTANQYHLWVIADPKFRFPFGFVSRVVSGEEVAGSKQRSFS